MIRARKSQPFSRLINKVGHYRYSGEHWNIPNGTTKTMCYFVNFDWWIFGFQECSQVAYPLPRRLATYFLTFLSKMMFTKINFKGSIDSVTNILVH